MSQAHAPDETRLSARAVLGVAVALLLAMLPGVGFQASRPLSSIGATHADHPLLAATNRLGDATAQLGKARGPRTLPAFGDAPVLLAAALAIAFFLFGAATIRPTPARAPAPARRASTTRARAPPRA